MGTDGTMTSGILRGIEDGWFMSEIADAAFSYQTAVEKGDKKVVGVNVYDGGVDAPLEILRVSHEVETRAEPRARGAAGGATTRRRPGALAALVVAAAKREANMVPPMLDAARAEATLGEICDALREVWGDYREPARFYFSGFAGPT